MEKLNLLKKICENNLSNSNDCLDYLSKRGFDDAIIKKYGIGYFPQNISVLKKYIDDNYLINKNILKYSGDSDFKDFHYLIIPIQNEYNQTVGISGRSLLPESEIKLLNIPKYKNSSYAKKDILFGLNYSLPYIIKKKTCWIVEGYFDQISMFKYGGKNSVALGGTAFSRSHFLKLSRYCDTINFLYDNDDAGRINSSRAFEKFNKYNLNLNFYCLKTHKDIDEYLRENKSLKDLSKHIEKLNF